MKKYDVMIVGPVSLDHNIDCEGRERRELGGAVVASGFAAARSGRRTAVFTKFNPGTADAEPAFAGSGAEVYWKASASTCAIRNQYFTPDKEKRSCTAMGRCDGFFFDELPRVETSVYHFAGLMTGDIDERMIAEAAGYGKVAVDVQGFLRCAGEDGAMTFRDWENKRLYLPHIDYLKTDAAEAEILTGVSDRRQAARILHRWARRRCSSPTTRRCWPLTAARCGPAPSAPEISPGVRAAETRLSPGTSRNASTEACPRRFFTAPR